MNKHASLILRVGLAITFIWIGVLIVKNPAAWASYVLPWAAALLPVPIETMMFGTGIFDILVGLALLVGIKTWIPAFLAAGHIFVVLITTGITEITVRDIGLLGASIALLIDTLPASLLKKMRV